MSDSKTPHIPPIPPIPPIGVAPENEDFSHPWIISAAVSALCFGVGFTVLYLSGVWANIWQWADATFLIYAAILTPVLLGFYCYGIYIAVYKLLHRTRARNGES